MTTKPRISNRQAALIVVGLLGAVALMNRGNVPVETVKRFPPGVVNPIGTVPELTDGRRIAIAETQVREMLRDADSASFRDARVSRRGGAPVVCGQVNANNGLGGKGGFQRFVSGSVTAIEEQVEDFDALWERVC